MRDVAHVRDGFAPQTNIVRQDGVHGVLMSMYKVGKGSTLTIVNAIKGIVPVALQSLPQGVTVKPLFDQSLFVRASINGVLREGADRRGADRVHDPDVPGRLAPDHRHLDFHSAVDLRFRAAAQRAGRDHQHHDAGRSGARGRHPGGRRDGGNREHRAQPCPGQGDEAGDSRWRVADRRAGVRLDAVDLHRVRADVLPDRRGAVSVRAAGGSRGVRDAGVLLPVANSDSDAGDVHHARPRASRGRQPKTFFGRYQRRFERGFDKFRDGYYQLLETTLEHRKLFAACFLAFCALSMVLVFFLGQDFFPSVDAGQMRLHVRARAGLRVEETARLCDEIEKYLRTQIPKDELVTVLDNIGLPNSGINLSYSNSGVIGTSDAEILVGLNQEHHHPTAGYIRKLREDLPRAISRSGVLLPAGRHRHADLELRLARAHRHAADRPRHGDELHDRAAEFPTGCGRSPARPTFTCSNC